MKSGRSDEKGDGLEDRKYTPGKPCLGIECVECFNSPREQLIPCNSRAIFSWATYTLYVTCQLIPQAAQLICSLCGTHTLIHGSFGSCLRNIFLMKSYLDVRFLLCTVGHHIPPPTLVLSSGMFHHLIACHSIAAPGAGRRCPALSLCTGKGLCKQTCM